MPLQLTPARPNCRRRPDYGIYFRNPTGRRKTGGYEIRLRLCQDGDKAWARYRFIVPAGTPIDRARSARDTILLALDDGLITTPAAWDVLARRIRRRILHLNARDGIRPPNARSARKAAAQSLLSSVSKSSV